MLEARNLHLEYPGRTLVRGLSFAVEPGQCWAILGQNGSGKTTLIHVLAGLTRPAQGTVTLQGRPVSHYPQRALARHLGTLLQEESSGYWGSVLEYVLLGRHPHARSPFGWQPGDLERALAALDCTELADLAQRPFATLSGGERQRARIAQLLAQDPSFFLLDEPTQHLDLKHQTAILALFRDLAAAGCAVAMVLHDPWLAGRFCDHALLIYPGGEALAGKAAELLDRDNLERLYCCPLEQVLTRRGSAFLPA